jgi:hypothetical protein
MARGGGFEVNFNQGTFKKKFEMAYRYIPNMQVQSCLPKKV